MYCNIRSELCNDSVDDDEYDNSHGINKIVDNCKYYEVDDLVTLIKNCRMEQAKCLISFYLNIRSLPKNLQEFVVDFHDIKSEFDIVCFTEARLYDDISSLFQLDDCTLFLNNRNSIGGGFAIYINSKYQVTRLEEVSLMLDSIETIFLKVVIGNAKYVVGCIYRHPKSDLISFLERFEEILRVVKIDAPGSKVLLHCDFNINHVNRIECRMSFFHLF